MPMFLSAVTEPAMLLLLACPPCPINALGAVNVRNRLELVRPDLVDLPQLLQQQRASLTASVHPDSRPVKRGIQYDLEATLCVHSNTGPIVVFRQIFTMLEFRRSTQQAVAAIRSSEEMAPPHSALERLPHVTMSNNDPLRWAALCKDYNFIHLSVIAARFFGLPGKVAHGNHVAAIALQRVIGSGRHSSGLTRARCIEVSFNRPVVVRYTLDVHVGSDRDLATVKLSRNGRTCVEIALRPLPNHQAQEQRAVANCWQPP